VVRITSAYTRRGDKGHTDLANLGRVTKTDPRIKAVGAVNEANAHLGLAKVAAPEHAGLLERLQQELFDAGADLALPLPEEESASGVRVSPRHVAALEVECDQLSADLAPLDSFVLPGGSEAAARLHLAATVIRRAEHAAWQAAEAHGIDQPAGLSATVLQYLNRLSDLVFLLARRVGHGQEVLWDARRDI